MEEKQKYEDPKMEIINLGNEDIITASDGENDDIETGVGGN